MSDGIDMPAEESEAETTEQTGGLNATGVYETAGEVVLYDTEQPLAWVQADNAIELAEMT